MNATVTKFIAELKSKELHQHSLPDLQKYLQACWHHYKRFKGSKERHALNEVWNKMGNWYNIKLQEQYPKARSIYTPDYLKRTFG